jgi:hypothetical protein
VMSGAKSVLRACLPNTASSALNCGLPRESV